METTKDLPENTLVKDSERLQLEYELIGFSNRAAKKLIETIKKKIDKWLEFYKNVLTTHSRCQTSSKRRLDVLPTHEEHLEQLQDRM